LSRSIKDNSVAADADRFAAEKGYKKPVMISTFCR
jgi:hypothetical protein